MMNYQDFYTTMKACKLISGEWRHQIRLLDELIESSAFPQKEEVLKCFLLYFSLIDDGNTFMTLDEAEFKQKFLSKIEKQRASENEDEEASPQAQAKAKALNDQLDQIAGELDSVVQALSGLASLPFVKAAPEAKAPECLFVIDADCLYTKKYYRAVCSVAESAQRIFRQTFTVSSTPFDFHPCLKTGKKLSAKQESIPQEGLTKNLIVTGGPGTGKTTSILFLLLSLVKAAQEKQGALPAIYMTAPSGKAAARMKESVGSSMEGMINDPEDPAIKTALSYVAETEEYTIHRLLQYNRDTNGFKHNKKNPFDANSIFVIDEASMIDVCLFASLLEAIPDGARVFILGDKDQLPSVENGAVFADLLKCLPAENRVELTESKRFDQDTKIYALASAVNAAKANNEDNPDNTNDTDNSDHMDDTVKVDNSVSLEDLMAKTQWEDPAKFEIKELEAKNAKRTCPIYYYDDQLMGQGKMIEKLSEDWFQKFYKNLSGLCSLKTLDEEKLKEINERCETSRILCACKEGTRGAQHINQLMKKKFKGKGLSGYHVGELLMVTRNLNALNLYNGDCGVAVHLKDDPTLYIMFKKPQGPENSNLDGKSSLKLDGTYHANMIFRQGDFLFYPARMLDRGDVDTAFAITIHKSQGSDYDQILVILPRSPEHPLLNKQIVYTGITRTRGNTYILSNPENLKKAAQTRLVRDTGVTDNYNSVLKTVQ